MNTLDELPHNFDAEQALLGAMLMNNASYQRVAEFLRPEHFADPLHGKLYSAAGKLIDRGQVANALVLKTYAESDADLRAAGGSAYLARLMAASVHVLDAVNMGRLIVDLAMRRKLISLASDVLVTARSSDPRDAARDQVERLEQGLFLLAETGTEGGFQSMPAMLTQTILAAEAAHHRDGKLTGISTGLAALDDRLGGLHKSDLVVLAARPGMGKTALATNLAFWAAMKHRTEEQQDGSRKTIDGAAVGFFSLEMSASQVVTRILAERVGVSSERVRRGQLSSPEMDRLLNVTHQLEGAAFKVDDTPALSMGSIRARARRLKRQHGLDLLVVDYLQLVSSSRTDGRVQEVSEISRGLKALAKELDIPVIALSQLSRAVEQREDKRPRLSDLRDSGTIEQDADVVMFIYREEYYRKLAGQDYSDVEGLAEISIAKNRHGPTGVAHVRFDGPTTCFSDVAETDQRAAA